MLMRDWQMMLIVSIVPLVAAVFTFGSFFGKKAVTAFYSMPVNKTQLFTTNALAGLILSIIPVIIFCAMLLFPFEREAVGFMANPLNLLGRQIVHDGISPDASLNALPLVFGLFLRLLTAAVFYIGMCWLALTLAGNRIVGILIAIVMPFVLFGLLSLAILTGALFVFGFSAISGVWTTQFVVYHNPAAWGFMFGWEFTRFEAVWLPVIFYTVIGAGMFAAAFAISRRRKAERTGNSVMFSPVKNVLIFLLSTFIAIIMSAIMYGSTDSVIFFYVGMAVGFLGGYILSQMIAEKTLYIRAKMKYFPAFGGLAAGLVVAMILFTQFGMGFFVNRVPATAEIYGVRADRWNVDLDRMEESDLRANFNTDPSAIEAVRAAHRTIIDGRSDLFSVPNFTTFNSEMRIDDGIITTRETVVFTYLLTNGNTVRRHYQLPCWFIYETELYNFLDSWHMLWAEYQFFYAADYLAHLTVNAMAISDREKIAQILDLARKALVQNAQYERSMNRQNIIVDHAIMDPSMVSISPGFYWGNVPSHLRSWSSVFIRGEYAEAIHAIISS
jgi:hypothetical protein